MHNTVVQVVDFAWNFPYLHQIVLILLILVVLGWAASQFLGGDGGVEVGDDA